MEILRIHINITGITEVNSTKSTIKMIYFDGYCDSKLFKGKIINNGIDTQVINKNHAGTLSARYMLEGTDSSGKQCKLFIENNALLGSSTTEPKIITDSTELKWLENASLYGEILNVNGELIISINTKE